MWRRQLIITTTIVLAASAVAAADRPTQIRGAGSFLVLNDAEKNGSDVVIGFQVSRSDKARVLVHRFDEQRRHPVEVWDVMEHSRVREIGPPSRRQKDQESNEAPFIARCGLLDTGRVWTALSDGTVRFWDDQGQDAESFSIPKAITEPGYLRPPVLGTVLPGQAWNIKVSPDGKLAAGDAPTTNDRSQLLIWDLQSGAERGRVGSRTEWGRYYFSADSQRMVTFDRLTLDGNHFFAAYQAWDLQTSKQFPALDGLTQLEYGPFSVHAEAVSSDAKLLAVCLTSSEQHLLGLWDIESGKRLWQVQCTSQPVDRLDISPDGQRIIGCNYQQVFLWDKAGKLVDSMGSTGGGGTLYKFIGFLPSGRQAAAISPSGRVNLLQLPE